MDNAHVQIEFDKHVASVALNDPDRHNALGFAMFDALDAALGELASNESARVILLHGRGRSFCAGFDLAAARDDPAVMAAFIRRLGTLLRALRRAPQPVVAAVHGAAIAGGCAIVSACDLVVVSATARLGYPVHRLGVSPAVTIPTLQAAVGPGAARTLLMGGELMDGAAAQRIGLATQVSHDDAAVGPDARALCRTLSGHGSVALRATKAWLNELDGTLDDSRLDGPVRDSENLAASEAGQAELLRRMKKL
jgi:methylglutaconyl-CoA hydratase